MPLELYLALGPGHNPTIRMGGRTELAKEI